MQEASIIKVYLHLNMAFVSFEKQYTPEEQSHNTQTTFI